MSEKSRMRTKEWNRIVTETFVGALLQPAAPSRWILPPVENQNNADEIILHLNDSTRNS